MNDIEILSCCKCGKVIDEDEYCTCWGFCNDCLDADYDEYLREHPEPLSSEAENDNCPF